MKRAKAFEREADLCAAFVSVLPSGWTAYPETCGFDIVLSHRKHGLQVGVEAKLSLNADVIFQAAEDHWATHVAGPNFRAVLVPDAATTPMARFATRLGLTVIRMGRSGAPPFWPSLPTPDDVYRLSDWFELLPSKPLQLPAYVPDVAAGVPAPVRLTEWKIRACKLSILLERRGSVTRADFKALGLDHRRFIEPPWSALIPTPDGFVKGPRFPDFAAAHPRNYGEIAADFDKWAPPPPLSPAAKPKSGEGR